MNANNPKDWLKQDIVKITENLSVIDNAIIVNNWLEDNESQQNQYEQIQLEINDYTDVNNSCIIDII